MSPVLIKLDRRTPQKVKTYSLGTLTGRNKYLAMTIIIMARITLVAADITEAAI